MKRGRCKKVAATAQNNKYEKLIERENELYKRASDIRSEFARDFTRILHSTAYSRLKHKTQVFFNIDNDHICTRMEHVQHVESVSSTIATYIGLDSELTRAIAMGHDLGHAPFGHCGEEIINEIMNTKIFISTTPQKHFWHEKNGVRFVDKIELLKNKDDIYTNLKLTYAVRDGIISHCGEIDENGIKPRDEFLDLEEQFTEPNKHNPITWEGCVVKFADKIAYLGRDIDDAQRLNFLNETTLNELELEPMKIDSNMHINSTVFMHDLIIDVCNNSSPDIGICLSEEGYRNLKKIKKFNYDHIYNNDRLTNFKKYADLVLNSIFDILAETYNDGDFYKKLKQYKSYYPNLITDFISFIIQYSSTEVVDKLKESKIHIGFDEKNYENEKIYNSLSSKKSYFLAIIDFISGMTDRYAVKIYNELISYNKFDLF